MIDGEASEPLAAVVLAAGDGSRMRSSRPKPLHPLCGRPMVLHVIDSLAGCAVDRAVVVVGADAERVTKKLIDGGPGLHIDFVEQRTARGTADALSIGLTAFDDDPLSDDDQDLLVLPSDVPLLTADTLQALVDRHRVSGASATVLTAQAGASRRGYGEVVRGRDDKIVAIAPHDRVLGDELGAGEVATGIYCFRRSLLAPALRRVGSVHRLGEDQLSDVIAVLAETGHRVEGLPVGDVAETRSVNDREGLAEIEHELRRRVNRGWLQQGVTMVDPERTYVDTTVDLGRDVTLFPGTILQGATVVGDGAEIGPDTRLVDCVVGPNAVIAKTMARDAEIGARAVVGPFAVLDPGATVAPDATTGPFHHARSVS